MTPSIPVGLEASEAPVALWAGLAVRWAVLADLASEAPVEDLAVLAVCLAEFPAALG